VLADIYCLISKIMTEDSGRIEYLKLKIEDFWMSLRSVVFMNRFFYN